MTRIILLAILAYILYRLLFRGKRSISHGRPASTHFPKKEDILVEDLVCHTYIPQSQALVYREGNTVRYFCSETCQKKFLSEQGGER